MTTTTNWENKFDKKRPTMEFTNSNGEGATNDFGYKYTELDEIHEVTDWGNIKSFIRSLLAQQRLELLDLVDKEILGGDVGRVIVLEARIGDDRNQAEYFQGKYDLRAEQRKKLSALRLSIKKKV